MWRRDSPGREQEGGALGLEGRAERASPLTEPDGAGEEGGPGGAGRWAHLGVGEEQGSGLSKGGGTQIPEC